MTLNSSSFEINISNREKGAASCRACGTHISFKKLETGRSIALEDDNQKHRCPEWWKWRADDD